MLVYKTIIYISLLFTVMPVNQESVSREESPEHELWVGAYLASWQHFAPPTGNWGILPTDEIDWEAFTHLYYFALNAKADGTLSEIRPYHNMGPDRLRSIVEAAHNAGTPVLFSVGGWGNYEDFSRAITPEVRPVFIRNLMDVMTEWKFDGIDLDMEPIRDSDEENYRMFVRELFFEMQKHDTPLKVRPLLTAATAWKPELFSELQDYFDQINLMSYDLSGAWRGWVTWHNAPVYSGGYTFPGTDRPLPSADRMAGDFLQAGVRPEKLGIGIDFYGYIWRGGTGSDTGGVTRPNQTWNTPPEVQDNIPYHRIIGEYYSPESFNWDEKAGAAYLSINGREGSLNKFISYDDENAIREKVAYAAENKLGGVFIWELSGGYRSDQPAGERDLLLQAVKEAAQGES